jgi:aspartate aminotransferase
VNISRRTQAVLPSATLAMTARAQALRESGRNILSMSAGEPDFDTPEHIKRAALAAVAGGDTKYTPVAGTRALRKAVAAWAGRLYGQAYQASETIVGTGGKQVLFNACCALLNEGDEALFASPYWVSYPDMIRFAGGVPKPIEAGPADRFLPQAETIRAALTRKTRLLILNSPSNPTGSAYTRTELRAIADVLADWPEVVIITDDIYSGLVYDDAFEGFASCAPELRARTLIATGVSKTYAMTGWRIGFGIGPKALIDAMADLQGASTSGACSIAQAAAVAALEGDMAPVESMRQAFKGRRDRIVAGLRRIGSLDVHVPAGAFYAFVGVGDLVPSKVPTSAALCEHLLESVDLALVPGSAFGAEAYVRLSFACSEQQIDEAIARLERGLGRL